MSWRRLACAWYLGMGLFGPTALAATLPTGYRIDAAGYPWTGRLHAITFHMAPLTSPVQSVLSMWEAGRLLDRRDTASRRLYLGGAALGALHWHAIDAAARDTLAVEGNGPQRLAWLRGRLGDAGMRPRDTRLGSASGARVLVIPPPTWQPLQPGHDRFRQAHARRPHTVWLATRDGFVHGFESATGQELMAFLPRALLARAGDFSVHRPQGSGQMPDLPCARPDTIDADVGGRWRTLLLCAIPATGMEAAAIDGDADASGATGRTGRTGASGASGARGAGGASGAATLFALDVSDPTGDIPLPWHWEISGHAALPLTGTGPLRVAAVFEAGVRRWYAVAIVADALHTGMVLLPLGRPPSADVQSWHLPPRGCGNTPTRGRLLAATVHADARGIAAAIYATDTQGQLWRFAIDARTAPVCVHRLRGPASRRAEAPVIVPGIGGPLVAIAGGSEVAAISPAGAPPTSIRPQRQGDGVLLPANRPSASGWTLTLPNDGEQFDQWLPAGPGHLAFTSIAADGRQRSYLLDAHHGSAAAVTGLPTPSSDPPIVTVTPIVTDAPTLPGTQRRDVDAIALWTVADGIARLQQQARHVRRRGRLSWRQLTHTPI